MPLFERNVSVEVNDEGDCLRLIGRLEDTRMGEPLHGIEVEMVMCVWDGEIMEISGSFLHHPLEECVLGLDTLTSLVGVQIRPGFSDTVRTSVGGRSGCTHLASLIMNMGNVSVQGRGAFVRKHVADEETGSATMRAYAEDLNLIDSCVCWRSDGPLVQRWREPGDWPSD